MVDTKQVLPQVGTGNTGNPTSGSDPGQARVAAAGSKDFGGSQSAIRESTARLDHLDPVAQNTTSDEEEEMWRHHQKAIEELLSLLHDREKSTVNNTTRSLAKKVQESFKRILRQRTQKVATKTTSLWAKNQQGDARRELFRTPVGKILAGEQPPGTLLGTPTDGSVAKKRKQRSPLTADSDGATKRASVGAKAQHVAGHTSTNEQQQKEKPRKEHKEEQWEQVTGKKKRAKEKRKNSPKYRKRKKILSKALLISAQSDVSYADILKKVKEGLQEDELEDTIDKVRRTRNDQLLIVLSRKNGDKLEPLQKRVTEVLGDKAMVIGKSQEVELLIRDIEETTTKAEIKAALQKVAGSECTIMDSSIRALRPAYRGTLMASIRLPDEVARNVLGEKGRIRIGLVSCSVKEVTRPVKCFKCWNSGHLASYCTSQIDRSSLCLKCGRSGHRIADCQNEPHCPLCSEGERNFDHMAGGYKCTVFHEKNMSKPGSRK